MTATDLHALAPSKLKAFYARLSATSLPQGRFQGHAWSHDLPIETLAGWFWQGKVFTGPMCDGSVTVRNLMLGRELIAGDVSRELHGFGPTYEVQIHYPQLGLTDYLKPVTSALWLGRMPLGKRIVWFTLERDKMAGDLNT